MKILILFFMLCSCLSMDVYRIGRHERVIDAFGDSAINGQHLALHVIRKSELMDCYRVKFEIVSKYHVKAICLEKE